MNLHAIPVEKAKMPDLPTWMVSGLATYLTQSFNTLTYLRIFVPSLRVEYNYNAEGSWSLFPENSIRSWNLPEYTIPDANFDLGRVEFVYEEQ